MKKQLFLTFFASLAVLLFTGTNTFSANEETYSGRVVAVNPRLNYFILEGPQGEKTFLAASGSRYSQTDRSQTAESAAIPLKYR